MESVNEIILWFGKKFRRAEPPSSGEVFTFGFFQQARCEAGDGDTEVPGLPSCCRIRKQNRPETTNIDAVE